MTKALPGKKGLLAKTGDFFKAAFMPAVYSADRISETQARNTDITIQTNKEIEASRQELRIQELKLQEFQRQANLQFQVEEGNLNRSLQSELARLNRESQTQEGMLNRQMQEQLAKINREFQANEGKLNREHQIQLEIFRAELQKWCIQQQKELQLHLKNLDAQLARELRIYDRQSSIEVIQEQKRQNNSPIWLVAQDIVNSNPAQNPIPLRVFLSPPSLQFDRSGDSNDAAKGFPDMEKFLGIYLQQFFEKYSAQKRPVEFLSGAWTSKFFHSQAATKTMFHGLKTEPTLILESVAEGDIFNLNFGYWGLNWATYRYKSPIPMLPWREVLFDFAKERALQWQTQRQAYIAEGNSGEEFDELYGTEAVNSFLHNLKIIEREKKCEAIGTDPTDIPRPYSIHKKDYERFQQFIGVCHCLIAGLLADEYFLLHVSSEVRQRPLLPQLLPNLLRDMPSEEQAHLVEIAINFYEMLYNIIGESESAWIPELKLDLAEGLLDLPDKRWAAAQIFESVKAWLQLRGLSVPEGNKEILDAFDAVLTIDDLKYVGKLNSGLVAVGKTRQFSVIESCYNRAMARCKQENYAAAIVDFNQVLQLNANFAKANFNRGLAYAKLEQYRAAIEDYTQYLRLDSNNPDAWNNRGNAYYKLGEYEQAIADYNQALNLNPNLSGVAHNRDVAQGVWDEKKRLRREEEEKQQLRAEQERQRKLAEEQKRQRLVEQERQRKLAEEQKRRAEEESKGKEFQFEIVTVNNRGQEVSRKPGKSYQKVADLGNGVNLEMVYIPGGSFPMGSSESSSEQPVHQVTVQPFYLGKYPITQAQWETVMGNNPSNFKGAKRPVENVNWDQAVEFCQKLSEKTGKTYRLPAEAEWEYACRAGTTTPFYFGDTITPDLVNYDGNHPYGGAPKGLYRQQTTDVGSFPPNSFGLYDMHGNVWEWCSDKWHDNYNGAPTDGSSWETGTDNNRVLRGGSWTPMRSIAVVPIVTGIRRAIVSRASVFA
ncbi:MULTISPECIES: SUMF1/EgtB/PvdO family nonheme iron enzyme [unclassified Microcoleus]|uniref:SUMF1/EgtB/PvdO family nonheme iron enzyme n=1 Tax=unclassified Microcoleus TaxID=2642155 RepID=UPI00403F924D